MLQLMLRINHWCFSQLSPFVSPSVSWIYHAFRTSSRAKAFSSSCDQWSTDRLDQNMVPWLNLLFANWSALWVTKLPPPPDEIGLQKRMVKVKKLLPLDLHWAVDWIRIGNWANSQSQVVKNWSRSDVQYGNQSTGPASPSLQDSPGVEQMVALPTFIQTIFCCVQTSRY